MTALLTNNLPLLAGAPNGIKKLRELILELAVRGKLVPQDPRDEPASELLKRIAEEKARQVSEGKIKKQKPLSGITDLDKPFPLPKGWAWLRLGDLTLTILSGGTPSKNVPEYWGGDIPWASVKDLNVYRDLVTTQDYITEEGLAAGSKLAKKGEVLICTRMGLGKIAVAAMDVAINQDLKALRLTCQLNLDYFLNFYRTLSIIGSGMTVAGIKQDELLSFLVPMPPLAEQHRIVAKVDELMALCDRLEARQADAESAHAQLVQALLGSLTQARDAEDFAQSWQRLAEHFHTLFTTESSIDALKQTLLQLAVMGKLVPQDPSDEPASELLKRIAEEKARLVAEGKLKKQKPLAEIDESEMSFELPLGWKWQRFADFALDVSTGPFGSLIHQSDYVNGGVPLVNPSHMIDGRIVADSSVSLLPDMAASLNSYRLSAGDIVMARRGEVGRAALVTEAEEGWLCGTGSFVLRFTSEISRAYVWILFRCHSVRTYLAGAAVGTTMVNLNHGILLKMPIAVPPITEQHRIVAKVDQLMALCDQLKTRLNQVRQVHEQLAGALVEQAVA
ncbi:restriction endonuclease subunit S [Ectopseudomonas oleovorans]|uniref:restriction endonuclease subunit S n=1 Tax=Ectopseudomonas oleovorans TaxID=301 RepID=UPI0035ADC2CE